MLQRCFLLGLFAVQSISQEHGGDEFKNWPERPGAWVQQTRNIVFFICSGRRLYKYNEDDIFFLFLPASSLALAKDLYEFNTVL